MSQNFQPSVETEEQLEELLSEPPPELVADLATLEGDITVLGAGGKMGPSLARMARRASDAAGVRRRVIAVARFSTGGLEAWLRFHDVETVRCDLLDEEALAALPEAPNVIFMAGMKFGSTGHESLTWAMNTHLPALVARRFRRSRIVAFSTGNVYGLTPVDGGGSVETDVPRPVGEYAMSCLGRERIFEHFSRALGTPVVLFRLNYANELRYGVLVDVARQVLAGEPVDVTMGHLNAIWQADANAIALRALAHASSPPLVLNVTGPDVLRVRQVATELGRLMGRSVAFAGVEQADALLSDAQHAVQLFGRPRVSTEQSLHWIADWVSHGGRSLGKPTHFEVRDGRF
jgi:nucleoside-diphosphate-sugar epimerase